MASRRTSNSKKTPTAATRKSEPEAHSDSRSSEKPKLATCNPEHPTNFASRWKNDREGMLKVVAANSRKGAGRPAGCSPGSTREETERKRRNAVRYANKVMKVMEQEGMIEPVTDAQMDNENGLAREALKELVVMLRLCGNMRDKLAIAAKILEYTKSKPAAKSDVKIDAAEDFLGALLMKEQQAE